jgi:hypothetical protein
MSVAARASELTMLPTMLLGIAAVLRAVGGIDLCFSFGTVAEIGA